MAEGPSANDAPVPAALRKARREPIDLPEAVLARMSALVSASPGVAHAFGGPRYEAYFKSGKEAFKDAKGVLQPFRRSRDGIKENIRIRQARMSPANLANLAFSIVSVAVAQEHLARIDRQLTAINGSLAELLARSDDEIAAPIKVAAASVRRFDEGAGGVPTDVAHDWLTNLKHARERIIPQIERERAKLMPTDAWFWKSAKQDLAAIGRTIDRLAELIELLSVCDLLIERVSEATGATWALDGVDLDLPRRLATQVNECSNILDSFDSFCNPNPAPTWRSVLAPFGTTAYLSRAWRRADVVRTLEQVMPAVERIDALVVTLEAQRATRTLAALLSNGRDLTIVTENGQVVAINELIEEAKE